MRQSTHATVDGFAICCYAARGSGPILDTYETQCPLCKRLLTAYIGVNFCIKVALGGVTYAVMRVSVHYLELKVRGMVQGTYSA
jgi:hypothetical protein